jgi:Fe2+ transport system protein FeoA
MNLNMMTSAYKKTITTMRWLKEWIDEAMLSFRPVKKTGAMHTERNSDVPKDEFTLDKLKTGESAVVKRLSTEESKNLQKLLAMGILPGRLVKVLQRYPAYILEIDRTQAAMDTQLAKKIVLKK